MNIISIGYADDIQSRMDHGENVNAEETELLAQYNNRAVWESLHDRVGEL